MKGAPFIPKGTPTSTQYAIDSRNADRGGITTAKSIVDRKTMKNLNHYGREAIMHPSKEARSEPERLAQCECNNKQNNASFRRRQLLNLHRCEKQA